MMIGRRASDGAQVATWARSPAAARSEAWEGTGGAGEAPRAQGVRVRLVFTPRRAELSPSSRAHAGRG
eukprot:CAMPEP_0176140682 /NCGR_PEP_ID=MMETSP0120_2-20121206/71522_1 /TAXON_ID=160619 /ORGANISM="Kryptoperidinium foliaceum, Strain CCMP 1326" /LENGTH=67 /DNA_ID=CAMNT_0017476777 /DNA_START=34 /DNA_END=233 /DNA_ORIENTATION=-